MIGNHRERLIFHGSIVILAALLISILAVVGLLGDEFRGWNTVHLPLIAIGIWMVAMAAVFPSLVLQKGDASALVWSLLIAGYGVMIATPLEAIIGVRAIQPAGPVFHMVAFMANALVLGGVTLTVLLTLKGIRAAKKERDSK